MFCLPLEVCRLNTGDFNFSVDMAVAFTRAQELKRQCAKTRKNEAAAEVLRFRHRQDLLMKHGNLNLMIQIEVRAYPHTLHTSLDDYTLLTYTVFKKSHNTM